MVESFASAFAGGPAGARALCGTAGRRADCTLVQPRPRLHRCGVDARGVCGDPVCLGSWRVFRESHLHGAGGAGAAQRARRADCHGARCVASPEPSLAVAGCSGNPARVVDCQCRPQQPVRGCVDRRARPLVPAQPAHAALWPTRVRCRHGRRALADEPGAARHGPAPAGHRPGGGAGSVLHRRRVGGQPRRVRDVHERRRRDPAGGRDAGVAPARLRRRTHGSAEPPRPAGAAACARPALRVRHGGCRPLQALQRHPRPRYRRPGAEAGGRAAGARSAAAGRPTATAARNSA